MHHYNWLLGLLALLPVLATATVQLNDGTNISAELVNILSGKTKLDPTQTGVAVVDGDRRTQCRSLVFFYLGKHACYKLEDPEVRDRISIRLLNCELTEYGRHEPYECPDDVPVRSCTNSTVMTNEDYSQFIMIRKDLEEQCKQALDSISRMAIHETVHRLADHAQNQLATLQREHNSLVQVAENMVENVQANQVAILQNQQDLKEQLTSTAHQLSTKLNYSVEQNDQLLREQQVALANQQALLDLTGNVRSTLDEAHSRLETVQRVMDEQQATTVKAFRDIQNGMKNIIEIVGYTGSNMNFVISILFYLTSLLVAYIVTTPRRVSNARFYIFLILSVEIALERLYMENSGYNDDDLSFHRALWALRQLAMASSAAVLVYMGVTYTSPEQQLAKDMMGQLQAHHQSLSQSLSSLFSRAAPDATDYDDPENDPDQAPEAENLVPLYEAPVDQSVLDESSMDGAESEDSEEIAEQEEFLEYADDDELDLDPEESLLELQREAAPVTHYRMVAGKQLRVPKATVRNTLADIETPDAFVQSAEIWRRVWSNFRHVVM